LATDLPVGSTIGGYTIESLLGRGGMSTVYLATDRKLGRKVAFKVMAEELAQNESFRTRFVREAHMAANLEHPNIVPVYDAGESDGVLFLAMRVIRGTDLRRIIDEGGGMDPRRITRLLRHVASALDTAHRAGLVHRDVKPGNILVVADGEDEHAYLADFGLTKQVLSDSGLTRTGQFMGTIDYVAPEQIRGGKVSGLTDEYSLGCVMYEGLTGEAPFHKDQDVAVMFSHLEDARPLVTAKRPDLPPAIDDVIARGMARSPEDRYSTCLAFVSEARAALKLGHADQEHDGSDHEHDAEHAKATAPENPPIPPAPSPEPHPSFPPADVPAPELQGVEAVAAVGAPSGGIPTSPTTSAPGAASGDDDRPPSATAVPTGQPVTPSPSPRELDRKAKLVHAAQLVGMALVGAAIATVIFLFTGNGNGSEGEPAAHGASDLRVSDFLLEHLPDEVRQTCTDGANPNPNAFLVTVACTGPDAIEVTYNFAHSRSEMIDHFREEQAALGIESGSGDCAFVDPGAGPWWRVGSQGHTTIDPEQGTIPEGKVFCHEDASGSSIVWVDRTLGIFASATITPEDRTTLFQWWADDAGPANPETLGHGSGTSGSHEGATGSASGMDGVGSATGPSGSTP
jgi:serine/threonine-protein kinase